MKHGLYIVPVRIKHKGTIVTRMVVRTYSGSPIVDATGSYRGLVELINVPSLCRAISQMARGIRNVGFDQPELAKLTVTKGTDFLGTATRCKFGYQPDSQGRQCGAVKTPAALIVRGISAQVIEY